MSKVQSLLVRVVGLVLTVAITLNVGQNTALQSQGQTMDYTKHNLWKNQGLQFWKVKIAVLATQMKDGSLLIYCTFTHSHSWTTKPNRMLPDANHTRDRWKKLLLITALYAKLPLRTACFYYLPATLQEKIIRACFSPVPHSMSQLVKNKIILQLAALWKLPLFNLSLFHFCLMMLVL